MDHPTPDEAASSLRAHAAKMKLPPGDNNFEDAARIIDDLQRKLVDRRYMLEAYHSMLGPNGLKVAQMWADKGVRRVHHSWGPEAAAMTGEERAAAILEWEQAERRIVHSVDAPSPA